MEFKLALLKPSIFVSNAVAPKAELCKAQLTAVCRRRNGVIPYPRASYSRTRYCEPCAYRVKLNGTLARKRAKRRTRELCQSLESSPECREKHRLYMQAYREFEKDWATRELSEAVNKDIARRQFIHARVPGSSKERWASLSKLIAISNQPTM